MKTKNVIIGSLHFNPLIGSEGFNTFEFVLEKAKFDLEAFEKGGVDAIIVENNYNLPHLIDETPSAAQMMLELTKELSKIAKVPPGVSVLWNDYKVAFKIAKETGATFLRVPVFVDSDITSFGEIIANPEEVIKAREECGAQDVKIYADIQVKHAKMINERSISESVSEAKEKGADGIIVTGKWTGKAPLIDNLIQVRNSVGDDFPIIVGSGASKENILSLFEYASHVIVSTSLKGEPGDEKEFENERNVKPFRIKVNEKKVNDFVNVVKNAIDAGD